ncbi:MAG TPA: hypothetical protein VH309_14260, partial [Elusimicrobiota bacterium]|nr:hypothetical protein [Elusimicrobiota bacterium]
LAAAAAAPARARTRVYDPEIALLLLDVQKESVDLVAEEMLRQAEWLELGSMQVLLPDQMARFKRQVKAGLTVDSDVVEDYRRLITDMSPGDAPDIDKLIGEIRRYHDLRPGPPLQRIPMPAPAGKPPKLFEEDGAGADVDAVIKGTPLMDEPVAYAERRFGTTGPFLRRRKWNLDFYLGAFSDLASHYRKLGYRRAYRLRAPYVSFGRSAYVLSPEAGLRPRLVYCEFYGQDLFLHTRAQWAELTILAKGEGPIVTTLTCPDCTWTLPGVKAMRSLLATIPYTADYVVVGYDYLFADLWKNRLLGVYDNDYWRLSYYRLDQGIAATLQARHTNFGEILAASLTPLLRRGASAVYFAGPAATVDPSLDQADLVTPTDFVTFEGGRLSLRNVFARRRRKALFSGLPSPLLATREWLKDAKGHGVVAFDGEMARIAEEAGNWVRLDGGMVDVGVGAVLGGISALHPEEDRAVYTVEYANQVGKESAKAEYRDDVLAAIKASARDRSR